MVRFWLITILVSTTCVDLVAQEWTRFRGPNGSGIGNAASIPGKWDDEDYNWVIELPGNGHSSPIAWGKTLFITSGDDETATRFVQAIDAASGKEVWSRRIESTDFRKHADNSLASGTPTVDADRLYLCWNEKERFVVTAWDHSGEELWRREMPPFKSGHGDGVSLIVHDDLVVFPNEHNGDSRLVALAADSGEIRWQVPRDSRSHWSTPCVLRREGGDEFIFTNWKTGITAVSGESGEVAWQADVFDKGHVESSISSPIVAGDLVLGTSGWMGVRKEVIAVKRSAGASNPEKLYCIDRSAPLCTTPLAKDDLLFLWSDEGIVTGADLNSGKVHWRKRVGGRFYSSPVWVGHRLFGVSTRGEVIVLAASENFEELGRNQLGQPTHSTPAIVGGAMYLRTFSHLYSLGGNE